MAKGKAAAKGAPDGTPRGSRSERGGCGGDDFSVDMSDIFPKRTGGRPRKFSDPRQLERVMQKYFNSCWRPKINMYGSLVKDQNGKMVFEQWRPYTVAGLALALGMSRETLLRYGEDERFAAVVERAKGFVHAYTEEQLLGGRNPSGAAFSLKNNFGWRDEQQLQQTATVSIPTEDVELLRKMEKLLGEENAAQ